MTAKSSQLAPRLAVEFAVIVAGVFVALAAESWWSEREERRYERELREDMLVEFDANVRILAADIAMNEEVRDRFQSFLNLSDEALLALPDSELDDLKPYLDWAGFDPEMGSVQAFVESGNVGAIADRDLRLLLARWAGLLEMRRRYNLQAVDFQHRELIPTIARAGADALWSESERREVQTMLRAFFALFDITLMNQQQLRQSAEDILAYLDSNG